MTRPPAPVRTETPAAVAVAAAVEAPRLPLASNGHGGTQPAPAAPVDATEAWRRARADLERKRPRIASLLATANVLELDASRLVLGFPDQQDVENAERARGEIEAALSAQLGGAPVKVHPKIDVGGHKPPVLRAETLDEADAQQADKRRREKEAREHPLVQKAQDLFGVAIREIKL